jgi:hypothetical protein
MSTRRRFIAGGIAAAFCTAGALGDGVVEAQPSAKPLLTEFDGEPLSSPKGIDIGPEGGIVIAQGAFGPPGPVLVYDRTAPKRRRVTAITEPFSLTDVAISPLDGTGWALAGVSLFHQLADGTTVEVLNLEEYQAGDPDPVDQEEVPEETNPYGLTVTTDGDALVADAAGNDVIRVTPDGDATTVARFDVETIATDHLDPDDFPGLPPELTAEAVPTTVTVGPDGAIYVGELKGFPFRPGSSHVWRIEPDAEGAWCSVNEPSDDCTVYKDDLTAIQDIDFNLKNGRLYVYELAEDGVLAFEEGAPAVLLRISAAGAKKERRRELAAGQLSQPGGIAIAPNGRIFVTDGMFGEGRMLRVTGG